MDDGEYRCNEGLVVRDAAMCNVSASVFEFCGEGCAGCNPAVSVQVREPTKNYPLTPHTLRAQWSGGGRSLRAGARTYTSTRSLARWYTHKTLSTHAHARARVLALAHANAYAHAEHGAGSNQCVSLPAQLQPRAAHEPAHHPPWQLHLLEPLLCTLARPRNCCGGQSAGGGGLPLLWPCLA
jgi:hypothetical protein